jgi:pseudaminic acid biosynthesis-associated methylase
MLTPQEEFWKGSFGDQYVDRNRVNWRARIPFWRKIIDLTQPRSILEVGCNIGSNLRAIRSINHGIHAWGCDINQAALQEAADAGLSVVDASVFQLHELVGGLPGFDLVCTVGMLIHVDGKDLSRAMDEIIAASKRYVLAVEYADETEVEVNYRGHSERLWRRPFGKLYEAKGLKIVAQGDAPANAFDQCAWWLCEKA